MIKTEGLTRLFDKPVTRKEFLQYSGWAVLGVLGVNDLLSRLQPTPIEQVAHKTGRRFGTGRFGV